MDKMFVNRGQSSGGLAPDKKMRHRDGLPGMMAISIVIHLSFFALIMVGERWAVRESPLQSYQVSLISPSAGMLSSPGIRARGKRVRSAAAPATSKPQAVRVSVPTPTSKAPVKAAVPATRFSAPPESEAEPPSSQASRPEAVPRSSLKVPRNADTDPERLEEWWKKKVGSIKVPSKAAQDRAKRSLMPQKKTEKIEIAKITPKIQIGRSLAPVFPAAQGGQERSTIKSAGEDQSGSPLPGREISSGLATTEGPSGESSAGQTDTSGMIRHSGIVGSGGVSGSAGIIGGGTGGAGNAGLRFPGYLQKMENKISGAWAPPPVSFKGEPAKVTIQFNIMKDGRVERESIQVEKSSGYPFFDQAAMRAIYEADPFPPFPAFLSEDRLSIHFSFTMLENS